MMQVVVQVHPVQGPEGWHIRELITAEESLKRHIEIE